MMQLSLTEACNQIRRTAESHKWPFFFMVGAGISAPSVPTSDEIVLRCQAAVGASDSPGPPENQTPMERYSWWMGRAYSNSADRQKYLASLIEGQPVTQANLHLAHLLLEKKLSNLVVTTNFDDFISRSLHLFGTPHVVCDHPATVRRIRADRDDIQIVQVHGSYWFYDCCNLAGEIKSRSKRHADSPFSMSQFLEGLLNVRSPLVIGYSGWDKDVFMKSLERRLKTGLAYNMYWFCHQPSSYDDLPEWLKIHSNVVFVLPPAPGVDPADPVRRRQFMRRFLEARFEAASGKDEKRSRSWPHAEGRLHAGEVLQALIGELNLDETPLTRDPLNFYASHLRRSLPPEDTYLLRGVVGPVERAASQHNARLEELDRSLNDVESLIWRSQDRKAIAAAARLPIAELQSEQLRKLMDSMWSAAAFDSRGCLKALELLDTAFRELEQERATDYPTRYLHAKALVNFGFALARFKVGPLSDEIKVYDYLIERYGGDPTPGMQEQVAMALFNKGFALRERGHNTQMAFDVWDGMVERFRGNDQSAVRRQVAKAIIQKGVTLRKLGHAEAAIALYDTVVQSFETEFESVATALIRKADVLEKLGRREEAITACEGVVERFGQLSGGLWPEVHELAATALIKKAIVLGELGSKEEEILVYDDVARRFGDNETPFVRKYAVDALSFKAERLGELGRKGDRIKTLRALVRRFGSDDDPRIRALVKFVRGTLRARVKHKPES